MTIKWAKRMNTQIKLRSETFRIWSTLLIEFMTIASSWKKLRIWHFVTNKLSLQTAIVHYKSFNSTNGKDHFASEQTIKTCIYLTFSYFQVQAVQEGLFKKTLKNSWKGRGQYFHCCIIFAFSTRWQNRSSYRNYEAKILYFNTWQGQKKYFYCPF